MGKINETLKDALASGGPTFGLGIAQGLSPAKAAMGALGDILLEKVAGPAAGLLATFVGVSSVLAKMVRQADLFGRGMQQMRSLEQMESKFQAILRSATLAKERMRELSQMSIRSPFKLDELANASRNLELLTRGGYSSKAALGQVADVAAATNENVGDLAFTIGKLYNFLQSGRSIQSLAFQLQSTGVISGQLQTKLEDMQAAGAGFSQMWGAVTAELNRFQGASADEMNTLGGLSTRLEAMREKMARGFGESFVDQEKNSIYATMKAVEALDPVVKLIGKDVASVTGVWKGFSASLKGSVFDALGASKALEVLWRGFTMVGGGLAAMSAVSVGKFVGGIRGTARELRANTRAGIGSASARGYLAKEAEQRERASAAFGMAGDSLGALDLTSAAMYAGQGAIAKVRGYGSRLAAVGSMASSL